MATRETVIQSPPVRRRYANRARGARNEAALEVAPAVVDSPTERVRRRSWARLLKRVFEVDPLLCPQCQVEMKFVAVIQDFSVVDRILAHLRRSGGNDPHDGTAQRGPPGGCDRRAAAVELLGASRSSLW